MMDYKAILNEANRSCLKGEYQWARECYGQLTEFLPDDGEPYIGLGVVEMEESRLDEAELCFRVACRLMPESSRAKCGLAMVEHRRGNYSTATDYYLQSYLLDRENFTPVAGLCEVSKLLKSYDKLEICLERYIEDHPDDTAIIITLACLHLQKKQYLKARIVLDEVKGNCQPILSHVCND